MGTPTSNAYSTPASSSTQLPQRDVADKIRDIWPASGQLLAIVAKGQAKAGGDMVKGNGMLTKRSVKNRRFECFIYIPLAVEFTTTSYDGSTALVLTSTSGIVAPMTLVNSANGSVVRVDSVTNTTTLVVSTISSGPTAAAGDKWVAMGPAYPEVSTDPTALRTTEDNVYNFAQAFRFPVSISEVAKNTKHYAVSDYWSRLKETNVTEGKRKMEHSLLFGERPASGDTNTGGTAYSDAFTTTRGMFNWAQNTLSMNGNMTPSKFRKDIPWAYTYRNIAAADKVIMLCGLEVNAIMQEWANEKALLMEPSKTYEKFGVQTFKYTTSAFTVEVMVHEAFNLGSYRNQALLFCPDRVQYCHMENLDLQPKTDIQSPSSTAFTDEIRGYVGIGVDDGGYSMLKLTNIFAL